jgi:hypothetical protein
MLDVYHKKNGGYAALLIYILSSCISAFEGVGVKEMSGILVVEGIILEENTKIFLSRTVKINEDISLADLTDVTNASIHIIDEGYNVIAVAEESEPGTYLVNERFSFVPDMKYALDIKLNNRHYQSAFVTPLSTPEIDTLSYKINNDNSIDIMVSTHDSGNKTLYCLWDFEEVWEIRSPYRPYYRYDPITDALVVQNPTGDNIYYCWASTYSYSLLLATTDKFENATIKDYRIHTLKPGNSRYSYLYSINVSQYSVNKEASVYFNNLQRNIDESGSLFAPQPSEMTGNIRCLSDPAETIIGYIVASKKTTSRLFIPMAELQLDHLEDRSISCNHITTEFINPNRAYYNGYGYIGVNEYGQSQYAPLRCVDCTKREFGNPQKNKPGYWPNDHQ